MATSTGKQERIDELKAQARSLASLPQNREWLKLGRLLYRLHDMDRGEFRQLTKTNLLDPRTAYYLRHIGQLISKLRLPKRQVERVGWTKLQVMAAKLTTSNSARLLWLAENKTVQELRRELAKSADEQRPRAVLLRFTDAQYAIFNNALKAHGTKAKEKGRGLVGQEAAILALIKARPGHRPRLRQSRAPGA
jgi:hypothetical protein